MHQHAEPPSWMEFECAARCLAPTPIGFWTRQFCRVGELVEPNSIDCLCNTQEDATRCMQARSFSPSAQHWSYQRQSLPPAGGETRRRSCCWDRQFEGVAKACMRQAKPKRAVPKRSRQNASAYYCAACDTCQRQRLQQALNRSRSLRTKASSELANRRSGRTKTALGYNRTMAMMGMLQRRCRRSRHSNLSLHSRRSRSRSCSRYLRNSSMHSSCSSRCRNAPAAWTILTGQPGERAIAGPPPDAELSGSAARLAARLSLTQRMMAPILATMSKESGDALVMLLHNKHFDAAHAWRSMDGFLADLKLDHVRPYPSQRVHVET